jgi:hypothetical protein
MIPCAGAPWPDRLATMHPEASVRPAGWSRLRPNRRSKATEEMNHVRRTAGFRKGLLQFDHHKPNDLFEMVGFVKENFPFYCMYIDHYTIHGEETVL